MTRERVIYIFFFVMMWGVVAISGDIFAGENGGVPQNIPNSELKTFEGVRKVAQWRNPIQKTDGNKKENEKKSGKDEKKDPRKNGTTAKSDNRGWVGGRDLTRSRNMEELKQKHPEFFALIQEDVRLEREGAQLKKEWKNADTSKKEELKKELKEVITQHFQVRQKRRLYELQLLEERIQEMRKEINGREAKMERIVNKRLEDLLEKDDELEF